MRGTGPGPSFEVRAGALAALVLVVLTGGTASAVALEHAARTAPVTAAPAAAVEPRVFVEDDLLLTASWAVPATAVDLALPAAALPPPPAPAAPPVAPDTPPEPAAVVAPADPLCSGDGWQQRRGQAALAGLRRPSDADAFTLSFEPGRSGVIGLATVHEGRLQVFVRSCSQLSASLLQHVVAHELGHLLDGARLSDAAREQWKAARGIPADVPWYGCNACTDFATPAGDFAEVYAQWQTGARSNRSQRAPAPSAGELAQLAARFF